MSIIYMCDRCGSKIDNDRSVMSLFEKGRMIDLCRECREVEEQKPVEKFEISMRATK